MYLMKQTKEFTVTASYQDIAKVVFNLAETNICSKIKYLIATMNGQLVLKYHFSSLIRYIDENWEIENF